MSTQPTTQPLDIFRPGRHVSASGDAITFTDDDVRATAAAYDPARHEAPLTVGHPTHDAPAYGWVKALSFADSLQAEPHQVDPAFAEMVAAGRFKKISASFYTPDAPQNPVPGVYYLRHVGFLGAQPPAVKGLRSPQFSEAESGVVEFSDWGDTQNAALWRRLREWVIGKFGLDEADRALPDYAVAAVEDSARTESTTDSPAESTNSAAASPAISYAEAHTPGATMTPEQIAAREAELAARTAEQTRITAEQTARAAEFAEREARITAAEGARERAEITEFVESQVAAGRVLPAHKEGLVAFMAGLSAGHVVEFGEGDSKVTQPGAAWLRGYLVAQPKAVEFKEVAGAAAAAPLDTADANAIARAAVDFREAERAAGREISVTAAVSHVIQGQR